MSSVVPGRVSVIIPCYNTATFAHRAIESSLNQTYQDVTVVPNLPRIVYIKAKNLASKLQTKLAH